MAMPELQSEPERVIAAAIWKHARGDPDALARVIVAELEAAGYRIVPASEAIG